jgi:aarF domain-containing kinase
MSPEEQKVLKEEVRRFTMGDVSEWLQGLDREFLTVLRTE